MRGLAARVLLFLVCVIGAALLVNPAKAQYVPRGMTKVAFVESAAHVSAAFNIVAPQRDGTPVKVTCPSNTLSFVVQVPKSTWPNGASHNSADDGIRIGPSTVAASPVASSNGIYVEAGGTANWSSNTAWVISTKASGTVTVQIVCGVNQ